VRATPRRRGWYGCEDRIAWLLRVCRIHGPDERLANASVFAATFRGGSWPDRVAASQISRWETAASRAGVRVLRRYEELLGLPAGRLVATADFAYREASAAIGPPPLDRGLDGADPRVQDDTALLLDRALSADLMSGAAWDELTGHLSAVPAPFLHPITAWTELSERLVAELLVSDNLGWLQRSEAVERLIAHPRASRAVIAACAALAADPTNQVAIEPLSTLDSTADPEANRQVLAQTAHPTNDRTLRGALLACVEKVPRHHFGPAELAALVEVTADLLADETLRAETRQLAAALLSQVPAADRGRAAAKLSRVAASDATARHILASGRTAGSEVAGHVVDRAAATATQWLPLPPATGIDPMLVRLLTELLFSSNTNVRCLAAVLLAATPYREPVAAALVTELTPARIAGDATLTTNVLAALPFLARTDDRVLVERLALAPGLPEAVTDTAAWTLGHLPGRSDTRFWRAALDHHRRQPGDRTALRGLVYSLGIAHHHKLLAGVRADPRMPAPTRLAARWWLGLPHRIYASTTH
jgi:hypothetical protein